MKKTIILMCLIVSISIFSKEDVEILVDSGYYPFSYEESGKAKGLYISVLEEAFSRMENFNVTMKPVPWKRGKHYMEQGSGFGLAPAFYHGYDWEYLYPYSLPFYTETVVTVFLKENVNKPMKNIPEDYKGLKVGNISGFDGWVSPELRTAIDNGEVDYEEVRSTKQHIRKLISGRVDCILIEKLSFEYTLKKLKEEGIINKDIDDFSFEAVVAEDGVSIGYSKYNNPSYKLKFRQEFDNVIYMMNKKEEIKKIFDEFEE